MCHTRVLEDEMEGVSIFVACISFDMLVRVRKWYAAP